uniref:ATP synthase subunit a n=1 Tax=Hutchinsoniella macracantha TaxID=84335 RepID=Q6SL01_9CRUS|nr:ATP synthase F0 subunit 6 [Hutchinsoniella macracantha]
MMGSLFSVFDPVGWGGFSLNWFSVILGGLFLPLLFWVSPSRVGFLLNYLFKFLTLEFSVLLGLQGSGVLIISFISLFVFILGSNLLGLLPFIFTGSSHLVFTLGLALPIWVSVISYGCFYHINNMFSHLVPQGTPWYLVSFMVCIELISNVIRPGTLSLRLAANMTAGHLLIALMGGQGYGLGLFILSFLLFGQMLLLLLELAVAFIQSYVFSMLSVLYVGEVLE